MTGSAISWFLFGIALSLKEVWELETKKASLPRVVSPQFGRQFANPQGALGGRLERRARRFEIDHISRFQRRNGDTVAKEDSIRGDGRNTRSGRQDSRKVEWFGAADNHQLAFGRLLSA